MAEAKSKTLLVLNRNYVLTTTKGHSVAFEKGKPTHVPPAIYQEALAIGAIPPDGEEPQIEDVVKTDNAPGDPAGLPQRGRRGGCVAAALPRPARPRPG